VLKKILNKLLEFKNNKNFKDFKKIANKVNKFEANIKKLTDNELKSKTIEFRNRIFNGETLDSILPEAFACVREASIRTIGLRHFDVQIIGGYVLHKGYIAEMKTGEGKTLVATLSAYLNALPKNGVHIVTVNDYLAKRDKEWMGVIYKKLGLTVGSIEHNTSAIDRKHAYNCDITYVTNNEIGFDYLRDNMVNNKNDRVLRSLNYAIIDEIDSILIDEARTPLIISGPCDETNNKYYISDKIAKLLIGKKVTENDMIKAKYKNLDLTNGYDYIIDEKNNSAILTEQGIKKTENFLGIDNIYNAFQSEWAHHIIQAIKANNLFHKDIEYIIKNNEIIIVDEFTGRLMPGRRWSEGLHQAIEAKENLKITSENKPFATITFQNFFKIYKKLSGMTGTAFNEAKEFWTIYKLKVIKIPTNKPIIRKDYPDVIYRTEKEKNLAIVKEIIFFLKKGQPVLVGTRSINKSEQISTMLKQIGIPHKVLNAKNHKSEAQIIAQAGTKNAVTIATNMAGRGTDIKLGLGNEKLRNEIINYGGLHIIGTERHEARRIDDQLRGRSGRQGDPGSTRFFLSMDDELMRLFGSSKISIIMKKLGFKENENIQHSWISKAVENAQKKIENMNFDMRKQLMEFDNVINKQRELIYKLRNEVLDNNDISYIIENMICQMLENNIYIHKNKKIDENLLPTLENWMLKRFNINHKFVLNNERYLTKEFIQFNMKEIIISAYRKKFIKYSKETIYSIQKKILLSNIDFFWRENLYALEQLKYGIGFRAYAQKDPQLEYQKEAYVLFKTMMKNIRECTLQYIFKTDKVNL
jgi:preprotein translocase subunit SecA